MNAAIPILLALLERLAPLLTKSPAIQAVIDKLIQLIPVLAQTAADTLPSLKNIITALQGNGRITDAQWTQLDDLSTLVDTEFEKAAAAAEEEDRKAGA